MHNIKYLKQYRRDLRNFPTRAEAHLWRYLRDKQIQGRKFRRQHSVGRYILDFYCPSERLCIELDGAHHVDPIIQDYDNVRTAFLVLQGIRVLRFTNLEAIEKTDDVIQRIVNELFSPPPAPSWEEGKYTL